ncbi:MAG TPA: metal-sensitive transcriptional regulator [Longimicrobiales bacterium]|nr:metal-sensitive transcriptional regulator [Longimicrobiales bacterium]
MSAEHDHERHATAIDPESKARAMQGLKRIEGQVRGLQRMVEEERYCAEVLTQISAVHEALRKVGKLLMRNHLEHCVTDALRSGDAGAATDVYDEVMDLMYRYAK